MRSALSRPTDRWRSSISAIAPACLARPKLELRRWPFAFDVTPREDPSAALEALCVERGVTCKIENWFRGYAVQAARGDAPDRTGELTRQKPATG